RVPAAGWGVGGSGAAPGVAADPARARRAEDPRARPGAAGPDALRTRVAPRAGAPHLQPQPRLHGDLPTQEARPGGAPRPSRRRLPHRPHGSPARGGAPRGELTARGAALAHQRLPGTTPLP